MSKFVSVLNEKLILNKNPEVKLIESSEVCPYIDGLQNLEGWSELTKLAVEPNGYCAAWSMFFTELCLKNPDIPSSTLMDYIFNTLQDMAYSEKKDYLRRVIRGYSVFINEKISKYFSILFSNNFTAEKLKNASPATKQKVTNILHDLIQLEMILVTNPNYVKKYIEEVSREIELLNRGLQNNKDIRARANFENQLIKLIGRKNLYEAYEEFNVFSNPSETISQRENNGQILKKMKANDVSKPEKIKSCPEGKEINPKTGRCVKSKTKTQKVRKNKTPKQQVKTYAVPESKKIEVPVVPESKKIEVQPVPEPKKIEVPVVPESKKIEVQPVPEPKKIRSCPEGKEINPKTGRCVKSKTQKVRKNKTPKQQVKTYTVPETKKIEVPVVPEAKKIEVPVVPEPKNIKSCPEGKEINPKTGRCVKIKTQKVKTPLKNKEIVCPEGCIKKPE
jgi:hypothetical protein